MRSITIFGAAALASCLLVSGAHAKVSEQEAARLASDLTPTGAERAGNADGSIPAWDGGITKTPANYSVGDHHPDPFAADQVLFTITAKNVDQYKDKLSDGQIAMFKKYPETFSMPVYKTQRSYSVPDFVYEAVKHNATHAELVNDGEGVSGAAVASPFPIPQNAQEVVWNHKLRYIPEFAENLTYSVTPTQGGSYTPVLTQLRNIRPYSSPTSASQDADNRLVLFMSQILSPAYQAGDVLLVHDAVDQKSEPRQAWNYNPGSRRVRRAPNFAFDNPLTSSEGQGTTDQFDVFNGSMERYNWTLVGKREMYVPYNAYKLHSAELTMDDIIRPGHLNQEHARYELHRVWEVEGNVKKPGSHAYAKRRFFIDEDSWQILVAEHYDSRGDLWRVTEAHPINYYEVPFMYPTVNAIYDLSNGRYTVSGINNQEKIDNWAANLDVKAFQPQALRRQGLR